MVNVCCTLFNGANHTSVVASVHKLVMFFLILNLEEDKYSFKSSKLLHEVVPFPGSISFIFLYTFISSATCFNVEALQSYRAALLANSETMMMVIAS